jgi:hypothetical protein
MLKLWLKVVHNSDTSFFARGSRWAGLGGTQAIFRAEYDALCARNGGRKIAALTAVSRSALKLMFSIARDRRIYSMEAPRPAQRARASAA